ncbi:hypothetical protein ACEWY4_016943 [Coilia grayii]|uniref:G-protein coupled receptors family 1 profile domain-containing protein n=1 Tax=Coilia grayii TaxID=363190 RepID=A0ABD1JLT4_9TELE
MAGGLVLEFDSDIFEDLNLSGHGNISIDMLNEDAFKCLSRPFPAVAEVLICVFYLLVFVVAVPGNLVVGLVVGWSRQRLCPSDLYLFHLAVADLLLALSLPLWAAAVLQGWVFGVPACRLTSMLLEAAGGGWRGPGAGVELRVCAGVWALGVLLSLPSALHNDVFRAPGAAKELCGEHFETGSASDWRLATRILRHVLGFLLPLLAMLACYGATVWRLLRVRGLQRLRAMRVIAAVVAAFLLCWCPQHLVVVTDTLMRARLLDFDCAGRLRVDGAVTFTQMLALLHCCVNPVLYAFVGAKFRRNLRRMVQRGRGLTGGTGARGQGRGRAGPAPSTSSAGPAPTRPRMGALHSCDAE